MNPFSLRTAMLLGDVGIQRLAAAHVLVVGLGGVGSFAAEALARAGVGALTLCDHDTVADSNRNRQLCALTSTLGQNKAAVMGARILDINPDCKLSLRPVFYSAENSDDFFNVHYDFVVDAIDSVTAKLHLIETAHRLGIKSISAMGTGNKLDPSRLTITDLSKTTVCPLARVVRKELKARGIYKHTVLFSPETPLSPLTLECPENGRRSVPGSVSWVPSCAGLMMGGYVVQALIGEGKEHL